MSSPERSTASPAAVTSDADIRDTDEARRDGMIAKFEQACRDVARKRRQSRLTNRDHQSRCARRLRTQRYCQRSPTPAHSLDLEFDRW